ncbi:MAG: PDZ domain-containing protein [Lachnospiraceae bacterium]|nr:PDZ domain-containing protein [Lachnospiraceae bacterium]
MSEENNKLEQETSNANSNSESSGGYSFWAEQVSAKNSGQTVNSASNASSEHDFSNQESVHFSSSDEHACTSDSTYQDNAYTNYHVNPENVHLEQTAPFSSDEKKTAKKHPFLKKSAALVGTAAVFGVVAAGSFLGFNSAYYHFNPSARPSSTKAPATLTTSKDGLIGENSGTTTSEIGTTTVSDNVTITSMDVSSIVENVMPSMVSITSTFVESYLVWGQQYDQESDGGGSGFIISQDDNELLIATNNHVVNSAKTITVTFIDGSTAEAVIKGKDSSADLAVISIDYSTLSDDTKAAIKVATIGESDDVKVGEMAIAIGNALGYGQSVTVGYVSAKDREITISDANTSLVVLQVDAAINPGNSGGALINTKGEVIGINSAKLMNTDVEGMGYAIPISRALPIVSDLMTKEILGDEEKGYLGIIPQDVTEKFASAYNWPIGAYVVQVVEGSSAANAGIVVGDIITGVNGTEITTSTELREKVTSYRVGTTISITYKRMVDGVYEEFTTDVTLMQNPSYTADSTDKTNSSSDSSTTKDSSSVPSDMPSEQSNVDSKESSSEQGIPAPKDQQTVPGSRSGR